MSSRAFRFSLETLLKLRENARDERRQQYADALRAEEILREQHEQLESEQVQVRQEYAISSTGTINVDRLLTAQRYEGALKTQQLIIEQQQQQLSGETERRREALVEADRQVRLLEKLREKQQTRHQKALQKKQDKLLDDLASSRYARG